MSKPKISLNKLGEYLDATPSRRKKIIQDQQDPKPFITIRYQDARENITSFLANDMVDEAGFLEAAQDLRDTREGTEFSLQDKRNSADAMENFLEVADLISLDGLVAEKVDKTTSSIMEFAGVDVSIRPDVILKDKETGYLKGAVKLHFSKTTPLTEKSAPYVAAALKVYLGAEDTDSHIQPENCYVVDISTKKVFKAGKAHKNRIRDIEAACEEIEARWKKED